jgi:gentisate 1,2-dioxygenase
MAMAKTLDELELRTLIDAEPAARRSASPYEANARYLTSLDGFDIKRPPIPAHMFRAERDRALAEDTPTGLLPLDLSSALGLAYPATTPFILSSYARIRAGETLSTAFGASAEIYHVIRGSGTSTTDGADGAGGGVSIAWQACDTFCLPGGAPARHRAAADTVLWVATNEPQLRFEGLRPPGPGAAPIRPAFYPMAEIRRRLLEVYLDPRGAAMPGKSVNLGNVALEASRTTTPSFTLAMNSLLPGEAQRGHRHNAVAVTLVLAGEGCYSLIDGARVDWEPDTVMITPPTVFHSHHNDGGQLALFLIVQDGGVHYHCRTMGFSFK